MTFFLLLRPLHIKPLNVKTFGIVNACRGSKKLKYDQKSGSFIEVDGQISLDGVWSLDHKPKFSPAELSLHFEHLNLRPATRASTIEQKHEAIIKQKTPIRSLRNFYPCTILFSTMNGFCSWRKQDSGTIFIEHLCIELNKRASSTRPIELHNLAVSVLKNVNDYRFIVNERMLKQVPDIYLGNSFVEKLYL